MSNYALQAEVSRLRSELNQIESENNALRAEIGSAVSSVNQADYFNLYLQAISK